jgi:hypothetical protein
MSEAANKELAKRWFEEVWNQAGESTIDQLLHPDGKATAFPNPTLSSSALKASNPSTEPSTTLRRHPHRPRRSHRRGRSPRTRRTCTMTHTGDGLGFPATGKKTTVPGSFFIHCRDDKITDGWNFMN